MSDNYTRNGAHVLARKIESFWKERGFPLIRAEAYRLPYSADDWGVRSNLVNGFPPRG